MAKKKAQARTAATRAVRKPDATAWKRQPKPKTAWELCQRVCEAIEAYPLAYYQGSWVLATKERIQAAVDYTDAQMRDSCGTAYCRAGWIVALTDGRRAAVRLAAEHGHALYPSLPVADRANEILGLDSMLTRKLFDGDACSGSGHPGTETYVQAGIRGLRAFMKTHEAHLKARSLRGV